MKQTKIDRENIADHLIAYELSMIGKTILDTIGNPEWFSNFTMTTEQFVKFEEYAISLIKKLYKCSKRNAEKEFSWFNLIWGLKIND